MRHERQLAHLVLVSLSLLLLTGCAPTLPKGASFKPLAPPDSKDTLIYIFRDDSLRGIGGVDLDLDGEKLGNLLNGEYLAFLVDPGKHELKARMKWLQIIPRSWNSLDFNTRAGETVYLRVWAAYQATAGGSASYADPTATSAGQGEVGLFIGIQKPALAREELKNSRRAVGH